MSFKISVVMASYLGDYSNSAKDRVNKFHRAVNSFLQQNYGNKELIIVSDGCSQTLVEASKYINNSEIKIYALDKQPLFSGNVRDYGCLKATGDVICYLDTDDYIGANHLYQIHLGFKDEEIDWVFFDDKIIYIFHPTNNSIISMATRNVVLQYGSIGTSSIAHRNIPEISWKGCDEYGHDWTFVNKIILLNRKFRKIPHCEYFVCHIPNSVNH